MSSAPSSSPPSAKPGFDLDYSVEDFALSPHRDSQFLYPLVERLMVREGTMRGGRTLDVASGVGKLAIEVGRAGGEGWGLEPSDEMIGVGRWVFGDAPVVRVRGIAETLPFRDGTFDRVICQGALDHFVFPRVFMNEAARVLKPEGRVVIALANYDSLSCKLGRLLYRTATEVLRIPQPPHRPYWRPPEDHHHKGDIAFVRQLGGNDLRLERCYGISLLWLLYYWGKMLDALPERPARAVLTSLDRFARSKPALADMIVAVWAPRKER